MGIKKDVQQAKKEIVKAKDDKTTYYWCKRIMKNMLRNGFFLVMEKEGRFTSNTTLSAQVFSKYFPEKAVEMQRVLRLANHPSTDKGKIFTILDTFGLWLTQKADK